MGEKRATVKYLQLKQELESVEREISLAKTPGESLTQQDIEDIMQFVQCLDRMYSSFEESKKRLFLRGLISRLWINNKEIEKVDYTDTFQMIVSRDLVRIRAAQLRIRDLIRTLMGKDVGRADFGF